ncbi:calcium-binding protein [Kitasatospora sp. NPDC059571]|uniref:calcium-binding protein n=1 Tax=Kitasatospora sp. NPDC059571 TaxID=3346871 RepID=UPI0036AE0B32
MRKTSWALSAVAVGAAVAVLAVPTITTDTSRGDTAVTSVTVNGGRPVLLGPDRPVTFPVVVQARDGSGIRSVDPIGVWGPNYGVLKVSPMRCTAVSAAASTCRGTVTVDPVRKQIFNDEAGTWFVDLKVTANDGDRFVDKTAAGFSLKRAAKVSGSGVPTAAVRPGTRITVKGWLARSFWTDNRYHGYPEGVAYLQFRPAGSHRWTTVARDVSDVSGTVSATVPVSGPGDFQWYAPGDKWTGDAASAELPVRVG